MRPSLSPPFVWLDVTWSCVIVPDPSDPRPGAEAHVWRSECGRMEVRGVGIKFPTEREREDGVRASKEWAAVVDRVEGAKHNSTIRAAMTDAMSTAKARAA